jgi:GR25 family glycosyltransferase involved in LPS biosynthesis
MNQPASGPSYAGYFINLDRSADRRAAMEAQLSALDPVAAYRRFPGVDGNAYGFRARGLTDGQIGCLSSHYMLPRMHADGATHLHVIEDDIVMAKHTAFFLDHIVRSGALEEFDLLFTESAIPMFPDFCRDARKLYQNAIRRGADGTAASVQFSYIHYLAGTTSYLVNRRSVRLISDILEQALRGGAAAPIDILFRDKVADGTIKAKCLFPFITSMRPGEFASAVEEDKSKWSSRFALELLRLSFFVECDHNAALELTDRVLGNPDLGSQEKLHTRIAAFVASGAYHMF